MKLPVNIDWQQVGIVAAALSGIIGFLVALRKYVIRPALAYLRQFGAAQAMLIAELRDLLRLLIYVLGIGYFKLDAKGRLIHANRPFRHLVNHSPEFLEGHGYLRVFENGDRNVLVDTIAMRGEFNHVVPVASVRCVVTVWPDSSGGFMGAVQPVDMVQRRNRTPVAGTPVIP